MRTNSGVNPGDLRHRILILQKVATTTDSDGYPIETWKPFFPAWAKVEPVAGREYFQAAAVQAQRQVRFTIRCRRGITAAMRLRWDGQDYEIKGPPIDLGGQRKWLEIVGEAVSSG